VLTSVLARQEPAVRKLLGIPGGYGLARLLTLSHPQKVITKAALRPAPGFTTVERFESQHTGTSQRYDLTHFHPGQANSAYPYSQSGGFAHVTAQLAT
jgi:hypothetical protein